MLRAALVAPTVLLFFLSVMHMQATAALLHPVMAVGTWGFSAMAVEKAMEVLKEGGSALDAVEKGINVVEQDNQEQYYVGRGGYPNAEGAMELDAAVMDGGTRRYGAVAALKGATRAVSVARAVLEHSPHNIIVGEGARKFAEAHGLGGEDALTEDIKQEWREWKAKQEGEGKGEGQHDTIGLICTDCHGNIAAGTSTSGWRFKHPGRVGDSPVVGSGLYADKDAGAAVATGDGEEIMRVCLSFLVVEKLREGKSPTEACRLGIQRLKQVVRTTAAGGEQGRWHEQLTVAVVCVDRHGQVGAASTLGTHNPHRHRPAFPFVVWREGDAASHIEEAADVEDEA